MPFNLKLNEQHDIEIGPGGRWLLAEDVELVAQNIKINLLRILGEDAFHPALGIPYMGPTKIFDTQHSVEEKTQIFRTVIAQTEGVNRILNFTFGIDKVENGALITYKVETIYGVIEDEVLI